MAIIKKPVEIEKTQIRIRLSKATLAEVEAYCQWANITHDYFFDEAAKYLFKKR